MGDPKRKEELGRNTKVERKAQAMLEKKKELKLAALPFAQCFGSEAGKQVLEELENQFCKHQIFHNDQLVMAKQAAERDLIEQIKHLIKVGSE